ncbi:hypothetical protein HYALB_00008027 [Hymenoscyphus albidus]|uniref:Uncharacterized protein n=1 Tax=Hymenoscyphus albidus TaxID=595503 RepID=A0A9N9LCK8_9HELO|nr:hypothetical protein HYALB_00008027 [Hymenoscyphus albidus]
MGLYGYGGGQAGYAESASSCDPSEAHWARQEYIYPSEDCFFAVQYCPSEPKPQIELFPDEEERLLEVYSPPASAPTDNSSSTLGEYSINNDFDEVMSIHFNDLLGLQSIGQKYADDDGKSRGYHPGYY